MVEYLAPVDTWPTHGRPEAAKALQEARQAGFWFKPHPGKSARTFGRLRCRPPEQDADGLPGPHALSVFKTSGPADGSTTAQSIRSLLRSCTCREADAHQPVEAPPEDAGQRVGLAEGDADRAEHLLDAADKVLTARASRERVLDLIELAENAADDGERHLEEAIATDDRADSYDDEARGLAATVGLGHDPWPPERGEEAPALLDPAAGYLESSSRKLGDSPGTRAMALRQRLHALRARLSALQEQVK